MSPMSKMMHFRSPGTSGLLVLVVILGASCGGGDSAELTCERDGAVLEDGLRIIDLECGTGEVAAPGMSVTVRYEAALAEGEAISLGRGGNDPYTFRLGAGQVVPAWDMGLIGMAEGGVRRVESPPELAYGEAGLFPEVPPNASVTFEVELLELKTPPTDD